MIDVSLLGTGGMMPLMNRFLTSLCVRINGSMLLIDCGEGTQVTLKETGWGFKAIDYICITHFHADHISGLAGLLLAVGNSDRTETLTIIGPAGISLVVRSLLVIAMDLPFPIEFIELSKRPDAPIRVGDALLDALPLNHRTRCFGYSISLPRCGRFDAERAKAGNIPLKLWSRLQHGETIEQDGRVYTPDMVLGQERKGLKLSYITDTRPTESIPSFIGGSDLFICEGLYGDPDKHEKARGHMHMIYSEAAALAKAGNVSELWLTHFSPAMTDPKYHISEARRVFQNTVAAYDRITKTLRFEEE